MGHYCWVCGRTRANERFSGKGHAPPYHFALPACLSPLSPAPFATPPGDSKRSCNNN